MPKPMKQPSDRFTLPLLDKPRPGRPRNPNALTPAQRAQRYRAKKKLLPKPFLLTWTGRGKTPAWVNELVRKELMRGIA
jgi:hypothetical protein